MRVRSLDSVVSRIVHDGWLLKSELEGEGFWWDKLDREFWSREEPFFLALKDGFRIRSSAAADVALRTFGACMIGMLAMPIGFSPSMLELALRDRELYEGLGASGDPGRFFVPPPPAGRVTLSRKRARLPFFRPDDGVCEDVRFESPFETVSLTQRQSYASRRTNAVAHARHWRHDGNPRPTIIAVHGFSADFYHLNEWFFSIPQLYQAGYDVLLVTLPFHGQRQERVSRFSGHGFFAGGLSVINEAFAQAVLDIRIFLGELLAGGVPEVGVMGVSLGGLTSALLASVEPRLAFAIPNVPVASLSDIMMQWEPIGTAMRALMLVGGEDIVSLRRFLSPSTPLSYKPKIARERLLIIGGVGDRLVPPKHARLLWDHWDRCRIHWFPGSHILHLDRGEYLSEIQKFFADIGFGRGTAGR